MAIKVVKFPREGYKRRISTISAQKFPHWDILEDAHFLKTSISKTAYFYNMISDSIINKRQKKSWSFIECYNPFWNLDNPHCHSVVRWCSMFLYRTSRAAHKQGLKPFWTFDLSHWARPSPSHRGRNQIYSFHCLLGRPQGPQGCQKVHNYPLNLDLEDWCSNIGSNLNELQKTFRSHKKWQILVEFHIFFQIWLNIRAPNFQTQV